MVLFRNRPIFLVIVHDWDCENQESQFPDILREEKLQTFVGRLFSRALCCQFLWIIRCLSKHSVYENLGLCNQDKSFLHSMIYISYLQRKHQTRYVTISICDNKRCRSLRYVHVKCKWHNKIVSNSKLIIDSMQSTLKRMWRLMRLTTVTMWIHERRLRCM